VHWALVLLHGSARRSSTASRRKVSLLTHPSSSQLGTLACAAVCAVSRFAHALKRPLPTRTLADITACERGGGRSLRNIKVTEKRADWRDLTPLEVSLGACMRLWASVGACNGVQLSPHDLQLGWQACTFAPVACVLSNSGFFVVLSGFRRFQGSLVGRLGGQFCKVCAIRKISASCVGQC
jgi:hypothetical protein